MAVVGYIDEWDINGEEYEIHDKERGLPNGVATLDSNAKITPEQLPKSDTSVNNTNILSTAKGMFDYTLGSTTSLSWLGKVFGWAFGLLWSESPSEIIGYMFNDLIFADDIWVAGTVSHGAWWSADRKTWTQCTGIADNQNVYSIIYVNGLWVAGSQSGAWWSTDGKNWSQEIEDSNARRFLKIIFANDIWVASTNKGFWWSTNGKNWSRETGSSNDYSSSHVVYNEGVWIAGTTSYGLWKSTDGKNWTQITGDTSTTTIRALSIAEGGRFLAGTESNGLWRSTVGGSAWSQASSLSNYGINKIEYANGLYLIGTNSHGLWWGTSSNSSTYTVITLEGSTTYSVKSIGYSNGVWIVGLSGSSNKVYKSTDGLNWVEVVTRLSIRAPNGANLIKYANGYWFINPDISSTVPGTPSIRGLWCSGIEQLINNGFFTD